MKTTTSMSLVLFIKRRTIRCIFAVSCKDTKSRAQDKRISFFFMPSNELDNPRITILPSLWLGGNDSSSLRSKPSACRVTTTPTPSCGPKKGLQPQPKALPLSRGRDATAPTRRSFIKVLLPKVGRREISYATELRLFVFAPLTKMRKSIHFWGIFAHLSIITKSGEYNKMNW